MRKNTTEPSAKMTTPAAALVRCEWARSSLNIPYHDREWGVPVHDDNQWFEFIVLEGAQAGLSWDTILRKRPRYRQVFDGFDPLRVAGYGPQKVRRLLADPGIVRNRMKIQAAIGNARAFLKVQDEFGSFDIYMWRFVDGRPKQNRWKEQAKVPARTLESDALSKDLIARQFRFVGSTTCYALMQATGLVNDHITTCFRYPELYGEPRLRRVALPAYDAS